MPRNPDLEGQLETAEANLAAVLEQMRELAATVRLSTAQYDELFVALREMVARVTEDGHA